MLKNQHGQSTSSNPSPESVFDAAIREDGEFDQRLDTTQITDEDRRIFLDGLREGINSIYWQQCKNLRTPEGLTPEIRFDYMASNIVNAVAFRRSDYYFVGATIGLIDHFATLSQTLAQSEAVRGLLGIESDSYTAKRISTALMPLLLQFVCCHELGHHFLGHTEARRLHVEFGGRESGLQEQAEELLADRVAVNEIVLNIILGEAGRQFSRVLGFGDNRTSAAATAIVLGIGCHYMCRPSEPSDPEDFLTSSHPPDPVRLQCALQAMDECLERIGRPAIDPTIFNGCMETVCVVFSKGKMWNLVAEFLGSDDGIRYHEALLTETNAQLADDSKRWLRVRY